MRVSRDGWVAPAWAREGRELMYFRGHSAIALPMEEGESIQPGAPRTLFTGTREVTCGDVLADGDRFLCSVVTQARLRDIRLILDWTAMLKR